MKNLIIFSALIVAAVVGNVGCTAHASVHGTNATKLNTAAQVAYVAAPAK